MCRHLRVERCCTGMTEFPEPADWLLDHAAFLRRLAHDLAGVDAGDDLLQDTWLASEQHPPRRGENLRGWFATVMTNLLHNRRRQERRRARHEGHASARAAEPSAADIAAREEIRQQVVAAVLQLPEQLRRVVVLRYYEGLDATAIGRRLEAPASTVRSRLMVALAELRRRLDSEHGGDRRAWLAPLAAWRRPAAIVGAEAAIAPILLLLGAAAAVLVLGVWWLTAAPPAIAQPGESLATGLAPLPRFAADASGPEAAKRVPAAAVASLPSAVVTLVRPRAELHGVVVSGAAGEGVPEIEVVVQSRAIELRPAPLDPELPTIERRAITDGSGRFTFADLPIGPYGIEARGADDRVAWMRVDVGPGPQECRLALDEQGRSAVTLRIVDDVGHPVADAAVEIAIASRRAGRLGWNGRPPLSAVSGRDGKFAIECCSELAPIENLVAWARDGRGRVGVAACCGHGSEVAMDVTIGIEAPSSIVGRLAGLADFDGVAVFAHPMGEFDVDAFGQAGTLAVDGSFRIEGLPAGEYTLEVRGLARRADNEQFWNTPVTVVPAGCVAVAVPATIACIPGSRVRGVVRDAAGLPIAGAQVLARRPWWGHDDFGFLHHGEIDQPRFHRCVETRTDADGAYELRLHPGRWEVFVHAAGKSAAIAPAVQAGSAPQIDLEHRLFGEACLAGRECQVEVLRDPRQPEVVHRIGTATFLLRGLRPGTWELGSGNRSTFRATRRVELIEGQTLWLAPTFAEREHRGVLRHRGLPLAGYDVRIGATGPSVRTGADGGFRLHHLHDLDLPAPRLEVGFATLRIGSAATLDGAIELPGDFVEVRAVDTGGLAVPAVFEIGDTFEGSCNRFDVGYGPGKIAAPTGLLRFLVTQRGEFQSVIAHFEAGGRSLVKLGNETHIQLVQPATGRIRVATTFVDNQPRAGVRIWATPWGRADAAPAEPAAFRAGCASTCDRVEATTNSQGIAELTGIAVGMVLVTAWQRDPSHATNCVPLAERIVRVERGQSTAVAFELPD
jgi:RNA polymerase sigma-70 factor, ECF subfamily